MRTDRIIIEGFVWKSQQNGGVFNPNGIAPCLACGQHSGVEPKKKNSEDICTEIREQSFLPDRWYQERME